MDSAQAARRLPPTLNFWPQTHLPPERSKATIDDAFERLHRAEFAGAARLKAPRPKVDANRVLVIRALLAALILIALFFAGVHARASLDELTSS